MLLGFALEGLVGGVQFTLDLAAFLFGVEQDFLAEGVGALCLVGILLGGSCTCSLGCGCCISLRNPRFSIMLPMCFVIMCLLMILCILNCLE